MNSCGIISCGAFKNESNEPYGQENENTPLRREVKKNEVDINPELSSCSSQTESFKDDSRFNRFDKTRIPVKENNKKQSEIKFQIFKKLYIFYIFFIFKFHKNFFLLRLTFFHCKWSKIFILMKFIMKKPRENSEENSNIKQKKIDLIRNLFEKHSNFHFIFKYFQRPELDLIQSQEKGVQKQKF
jgi:hypothetical protein